MYVNISQKTPKNYQSSVGSDITPRDTFNDCVVLPFTH
jgi:hypothetical protein